MAPNPIDSASRSRVNAEQQLLDSAEQKAPTVPATPNLFPDSTVPTGFAMPKEAPVDTPESALHQFAKKGLPYTVAGAAGLGGLALIASNPALGLALLALAAVIGYFGPKIGERLLGGGPSGRALVSAPNLTNTASAAKPVSTEEKSALSSQNRAHAGNLVSVSAATRAAGPLSQADKTRLVKEAIEKAQGFSGYDTFSVENPMAASQESDEQLRAKGLQKKSFDTTDPVIGVPKKTYVWSTPPTSLENTLSHLQNPKVTLPNGVSIEQFNAARKALQKGLIDSTGITNDQAVDFAKMLGGVTFEATLPYKTQYLIDPKENPKGDQNVHMIFQSGLNLAGTAGGGIPYTGDPAVIEAYSEKNAQAAIESAMRNKSDALVFNVLTGTGFFAGPQKPRVQAANVEGLLKAVRANQERFGGLQIVVPKGNLTAKEVQSLQDAGIHVAAKDKDAVTAILAEKGMAVSQTIAADPLSMLGVQSPGLWWMTVGSASDEERAAYLSECYKLGHIPVSVYDSSGNSTKIPAMNQFMVNPA